MTCLLPTYWTVLPLIYFAYTNHTVKRKKPWLINITAYLEIPQKQTNKNLNWSNKIWGIHGPFWTWFSRFLFPPSTLCHKSSTRFPKLVRSLSANSASFPAMSLWPLNGIFWSKQFHSIHNGNDSPTGFLNASLFFSIFSLCVKSNTFFIRISLPLYHSFIQGWFIPLSSPTSVQCYQISIQP